MFGSLRSRIGPSLIRRKFSKVDFGFQQVDTTEKEKLVKDVFNKVAEKYDIMNDVMSLGIHRLWKDSFVSMMGINALKHLPSTLDSDSNNNSSNSFVPKHLDVAGGTGDIAFRSVEELVKTFSLNPNNFQNQVTVCDINASMLEVGKERAVKVLGVDKAKMVNFIEGNAEKLPFGDAEFDFYTIAFGLRNVTNKDKALDEAFRVLKPGGKLMILEFSQLENPLLQTMYDEYSFNIIPPMGKIVSGDAESYQYLVESIRKFPSQNILCSMIRNSGFSEVSYVNMSGGIVAVHSGFKI